MTEAATDEKEVAWPGFEKFTTVQDILDHNKLSCLGLGGYSGDRVHYRQIVRRVLIKEINANHEGCTPEGLARNVVLIRELNSNLAKVSFWRCCVVWRFIAHCKQVVEVYQELSSSFVQLAADQQQPGKGLEM